MGNCRGEERSFRLHAHQEWGRLHWRNDASGTSESECTSALVSLFPGFRLQGKRGEGEAVGRHPLHGADVHGECWDYVGGRRSAACRVRAVSDRTQIMIDVIDHGPVRELRLNRPPANALSGELITALLRALGTASHDEARALVLSGSPGMFSAGLDV